MPDNRNRSSSLRRLSAFVLPSAAIAIVEAFRWFGLLPPIPFLLLLGSVVAAATLDGRRGALVATAIAGLYVLYAYHMGFGPPNLIGSLPLALLGIAVIGLVAVLLGGLQDRRLRLQKTLKGHADAHYQALVDDAPEAICVADLEGRIVRGNPKFHEMFGIRKHTESQYTIGDISAARQDDGDESADAAMNYIRQAVEQGPVTFEWRHRRLDGSTFPAEIAMSKLHSDRGPLVRGAVQDITRRKQAESLREGESATLRLIANGAPLPPTLDSLAQLVDVVLPEALCSVLLLDDDGRHVRHGSAPGLSTEFSNAIDGLEIGPATGSCGTAMYHRETIISDDIETDPRWDAYRELARAEQLQACWSFPIMDSGQRVLGSFAVYYRSPRRPTTEELEILSELCSIAGIAIEQARRSQALSRSEALYRATFEHAAVGVAHVAVDGCFLHVNHEYGRMLGYSPDELREMSFHDVTHADDLAESEEGVSAILRGERDVFRTEKRWIRNDGDVVWVNLSLSPVRNAGGDVEHFVAVVQDISQTRELSEKLIHEVRHDALTGLINRHEFDRQLSSMLDEVNQDHAVGAFLYIDMDQFKVVNDTAGHTAGDALLQQLAPLLQRQVRSSDLVGRLGGDEFGVMLRGCSEEAMDTIADSILNAIRSFAFGWEERNFRLSASIGAVLIEADKFQSTTDVLQIADTVCYAAKDAGRDRFVMWRENDDRLYRRRGEMQWVPRINDAIENGKLFVMGQAIAALESGEENLVWLELLIRLRDEEQGILPGAFMPAVERYALAPKIDDFVIETAIDWLARNCGSDRNCRLSVNLSGTTINDHGFVNRLVARLGEIGSLARSLCFEVTETAAIANLAEATVFIEKVRAFGCRFALDDFGSGLSSFSYLKNLPVDYLKIDGAFVRDLENNPTDAAVVRAIIEVGRTLGKQMVAEFVENERIMTALRRMGVDYVQGFHIGHPQPLEDMYAGDREPRAVAAVPGLSAPSK